MKPTLIILFSCVVFCIVPATAQTSHNKPTGDTLRLWATAKRSLAGANPISYKRLDTTRYFYSGDRTYDFRFGLWKFDSTYSWAENGTLQQKITQDFDTNGRITERKIYQPSGTSFNLTGHVVYTYPNANEAVVEDVLNPTYKRLYIWGTGRPPAIKIFV
ncbi:MAG: hypothetical protein EOP56_17930 [Sphingobacteriales bacterium]|nr:MAG: hypothetical protein EOP56_17930 [Sphingobacteriales bacterium]